MFLFIQKINEGLTKFQIEAKIRSFLHFIHKLFLVLLI